MSDSSNPIDEFRSLGGSIIAIWLIALIAVCLRFLARRLSKARLWYDDWLIIPPILVATALCFISATWMVNSETAYWMSSDPSSHEFNIFEVALLGSFISQICWVFVLWMVKWSILAFYWRLFSRSSRSTRLVIWTIAVAVMCWGISVLFMTIFQCSPIDSFWEWDYDVLECNGEGTGFPLPKFIGCTIPHIVIDAMLLIFPMPLVWKLQMRRSQKVMLTVVFALGGFVTVMSAVRLGLFFTESVDDNTFDPPFLLTNIEINTSIICACLPSLGPIITFLFAKVAQLRERISTYNRESRLFKDRLARYSIWGDGPNPVLDSLPTVEAEANPHVPESGAETAGLHVLEMETMKSVSAMETSERALGLESQRPIAKLEGIARMPPLP